MNRFSPPRQITERRFHSAIAALLIPALTITLFGFFLLATSVSANAQSAEELFHKAVRMERSSGDYAAAIETYRGLLNHSDLDRPLEAQALLQMGKAFESLGRAEAFSIYERLVRDFKDQKNQVSEAEQRLEKLISSNYNNDDTDIRAYLLPFRTAGNSMPSGYYGAAPSLSGRFLAREGENGGMTIDDLLEGTTNDYTYTDLGCEGDVYTMRFSPDEEEIVYACWLGENGRGMGSRIYNFASRSSRLFISGPEFLDLADTLHFEIEVYDWSKNGNGVLASVQGWDCCGSNTEPYSKGKHHVALIPTDGGTPTIIDSEYWRSDRNFREMNACLMHDDSVMYAEYDVKNPDYKWTVDIRSVVISTKQETINLGEIRSDFELFGCDAARSLVYYSKTQLEARFLYSAESLADGQLVNHKMLRALPTDADPIMSQNGGIYYAPTYERKVALLELEVDPDTGQMSGAPVKISDRWDAVAEYTLDDRLIWRSRKAGAYVVANADGSSSVIPITLDSKFRIIGNAGTHLLAAGPRNMDGSYQLFLLDENDFSVIDSFDGVQISPDLKTVYKIEGDFECLIGEERSSTKTVVRFCKDGYKLNGLRVDPFSGRIAIRWIDEKDRVIEINSSIGKLLATTSHSETRSAMRWAGGKFFVWPRNSRDIQKYDPDTGIWSKWPVLENLGEHTQPQASHGFAISQTNMKVAIWAYLRSAPSDVELFVLANPTK